MSTEEGIYNLQGKKMPKMPQKLENNYIGGCWILYT